jgi:hypothetical protein
MSSLRIHGPFEPLPISAVELRDLVAWACVEWGAVPDDVAERIARRVALEHRRAHAWVVPARPARQRALAGATP